MILRHHLNLYSFPTHLYILCIYIAYHIRINTKFRLYIMMLQCKTQALQYYYYTNYTYMPKPKKGKVFAYMHTHAPHAAVGN